MKVVEKVQTKKEMYEEQEQKAPLMLTIDETASKSGLSAYTIRTWIAYVRVSTVEQNEARQVEALKVHDIEKWYIEKVSAKDTNRPKLKEMLEYVREGDTIYIHDFSRLARSTKDLLGIAEQLEDKGVHLVSNKENIDTSTPTGKLMLTMIGAIAEFERSNLLERQREGIAIAKQENKYKGRKAKDIKNFDLWYSRYKNREINKVQLIFHLF